MYTDTNQHIHMSSTSPAALQQWLSITRPGQPHSPRPESLAAARRHSPRPAVHHYPRPVSLAVARVTRVTESLTGSVTRRRLSDLGLSDSPPPLRQSRSLHRRSDLEPPDRHIWRSLIAILCIFVSEFS